MTESTPALPAAQKRAAEAVLARAWGERAEVRSAERIWDRAHVVRLGLADGRSVVLKRRGDPGDDEDPGDQGFGTELAALELLNGMPVPVASPHAVTWLGAGLRAKVRSRLPLVCPDRSLRMSIWSVRMQSAS